MCTNRLDPAHIHIRRAEPDDYHAVYALVSCPKAQAGTLQLPFPSLELWRQRMTTPASGTHTLVAEVDGQLVGNIGLHLYPERPRRRHAASIGMAVHDDWQGRGIGSALLQACLDLADQWLNLSRIELEVYTDNAAAIHLYERYGFEREGTLRKYAFRDGRFVDAYVMARLRDAAG
jgi:putative acetyltransferase